jgi:molybdopterin synthase sulfur carrier subunit
LKFISCLIKLLNLMKIKVLFFGVCTEITGSDVLYIETSNSIEDLKNILHHQFPELQRHTHRIAVNHQLIEIESGELKPGDEVAFLPPFSGG